MWRILKLLFWKQNKFRPCSDDVCCFGRFAFFAHPTADQRLMSAIKTWSAPDAWSRLRWNDLSFMQQDVAISQPADIYIKQQVPWLRGQCPVWMTILSLYFAKKLRNYLKLPPTYLYKYPLLLNTGYPELRLISEHKYGHKRKNQFVFWEDPFVSLLILGMRLFLTSLKTSHEGEKTISFVIK